MMPPASDEDSPTRQSALQARCEKLLPSLTLLRWSPLPARCSSRAALFLG